MLFLVQVELTTTMHTCVNYHYSSSDYSILITRASDQSSVSTIATEHV